LKDGAELAGEKMNVVYTEAKKGVKEGKSMADKAMKDAWDSLPEDQRRMIEDERSKMNLKIQKMKASALDMSGPAMDKV